jgi:transposase-like protein
MSSDVIGIPFITYQCPACGGRIVKVFPRGNVFHFRWTCMECQRDYCWDTSEPCI